MKKHIFFISSLIVFCFWGLNVQIVTTIPSGITENDAVELIFDATQGATGLKDYTGDVYAHTGVITNLSTSDSDWKYVKAGWTENKPECKMTALGNNKWKLAITPDIRQYYGIANASETARKLAFVFRSADGSKEGKDTGGKDIFVNVYPVGLSVFFTSPANLVAFVEKGKNMDFTIQATQLTSIQCKIDGEVIGSKDNTTELKVSHSFTQEGNFDVAAEAGSGSSIVRDTVRVIVRPETSIESRPAGIRPGINIQDELSVTLCLYAPKKEFVYLIGDFNDWKISNDYLMKKDGDYWWLTISPVKSGQENAYQYLVDGKLRIADPYADKILDPWNDSYIPSSVYPDLKPYPTDETSGIVSVFQTGQMAYHWKNTAYQPPVKDKLVIYEMLLRDFVTEHSFPAAAQKLDYLKTLGVNAVELMPVNEFEGNDSWGYNPSFYFAVDKYYGTKNDFKSFVEACHDRGMAVIMDMVLNHSYGQSPFVRLYWDETNNRPAVDNPWYNITSPNPTYSWGYDFNHESAQTQALVDSICSYWMSEYHIDGFRFDFTKGFTQKTGDGWAYDDSRIAILKRMTSEIYKRNPQAIVIFEHLTENNEEVELADADIMLWGNMNNNYCEGIMGYTASAKSDLTWSLYKARGFHQPNLVAYMESHDEERMMYKASQWGNTSGSYDPKNRDVALDRAKLSACFYLPVPGPKMIWQFGELGYDYSINYCPDGTVSDNCRLASKPVRWDYADDDKRGQLYDFYSDLNYLKQNYPVFSTTDFSYSLQDAFKYFVWKGGSMHAFAVGNFDVKATSGSLTLPKAGTWYEVFTGQTIESSVAYTVTLQPGEYRLYTDTPVKVPSGIEEIFSNNTFGSVYPNPATDVLILNTDFPVKKASVYTLWGQLIKEYGDQKSLNVSDLPKGIYLLRVDLESRSEMLKFVKK